MQNQFADGSPIEANGAGASITNLPTNEGKMIMIPRIVCVTLLVVLFSLIWNGKTPADLVSFLRSAAHSPASGPDLGPKLLGELLGE